MNQISVVHNTQGVDMPLNINLSNPSAPRRI